MEESMMLMCSGSVLPMEKSMVCLRSSSHGNSTHHRGTRYNRSTGLLNDTRRLDNLFENGLSLPDDIGLLHSAMDNRLDFSDHVGPVDFLNKRRLHYGSSRSRSNVMLVMQDGSWDWCTSEILCRKNLRWEHSLRKHCGCHLILQDRLGNLMNFSLQNLPLDNGLNFLNLLVIDSFLYDWSVRMLRANGMLSRAYVGARKRSSSGSGPSCRVLVGELVEKT